MKKDIIIPEVENVLWPQSKNGVTTLWSLVRLLVNDSDFLIEKLVVSKAFEPDENENTVRLLWKCPAGENRS
jgi:hypothetical protein